MSNLRPLLSLFCVPLWQVSWLGEEPVAGVWSEKGQVEVFALRRLLQVVDDPQALAIFLRDEQARVKPIFSFAGHMGEGFALDWSPRVPGEFGFSHGSGRMGCRTFGKAGSAFPTKWVRWFPAPCPGRLLTGDCQKNIHLWTPTDGGSWNVDQRPFVGHTRSVEDLQWSPTEDTVRKGWRPRHVGLMGMRTG